MSKSRDEPDAVTSWARHRFMRNVRNRRAAGDNAPRPRIELCDAVGFGVIVRFPSGVLFSNRTCGLMCSRPELEGIYVPIRNDCVLPARTLMSPEGDLEQLFSGYEGMGLLPQDADKIDAIFAKWRLGETMRVDRSMLGESHESWVYVELLARDGLIAGLGPYPRPGVVTWSNSDGRASTCEMRTLRRAVRAPRRVRSGSHGHRERAVHRR